MPLPYGTRPAWHGPATVVPVPAPELTVLGSEIVGESTLIDLEIASPRDADILILHVDRPIEQVTISVDGLPSVEARPSSADSPEGELWPHELRFYDPPPEGVRITLQVRGSEAPRVVLGDATAGLEEILGFRARPSGVGQSTDHSSDLLIVVRRYDL